MIRLIILSHLFKSWKENNMYSMSIIFANIFFKYDINVTHHNNNTH